MTSSSEKLEAMEPTVRAILDDVVVEDDGLAYIDNYASWIVSLRGLRAKQPARVFVQIAVLATQFSEAGCKSVGLSLAALSRIGLLDGR